jgi:hypothetical protein
MAMSVEPRLAEGWPGRTVRSDAAQGGAGEEPVPGEGALGGERWLLVWNRDGFGECCCWRGTVRADGVAGKGSCARPGKHPWVVRVDGEAVGFLHGAADALGWEELQDRYGPGGGSRQLAVVLDGLLVVDLDGQRAVRDFSRLASTVPGEKVLGVSTSPRGYHVWLAQGGWDQRSLNLWMAQWLAPFGGWHGTDAGKAGRRGFLVDVRTGVNRFAVWPGADALGQRRWLSRSEFGRVLGGALAGMPAWRKVGSGPLAAAERAPWAVVTGDEWLAGWIREHRGSTSEIDVQGFVFDGSDGELDRAWDELERWLGRLEQLAPGSGRNNLLNQVSYYSGAKAVAAGHALEVVRARLVQVGEEVGTHGVAATVDSGLRSGLAALKQQQQQQQQAGS